MTGTNWAISEADRAQVAKMLVEASTNIGFEVTVERKSGKALRGRIHEVIGKYDHAASKGFGAILFAEKADKPTLINVLQITRISRAPGT